MGLTLRAACGCPKWLPYHFVELLSFEFLGSHNEQSPHGVGLIRNMARLKRFELLTARFVAEYSIQLSYRRIIVVVRLEKARANFAD
jgi:hypothetical protein